MSIDAATRNTVGPSRPRAEVTGLNPERARARVRDLMHRELLCPADLVAPILVQPDARDPRNYRHLPGAVALDELPSYVRKLRTAGIRAVKVFVYVTHKTRDAADAVNPDNLMIAAVQSIRASVPDMVISTEVCGCAWTDTGECALLSTAGRTDSAATLELMAHMAVLHAQAGADIIGPAAVLDGSVHAIRFELDEAGFPDVGLTPSVIFDSALFTAYKSAMHTDPGRGNRRGFQIDACHHRQALEQADRWIAEGADALLVQPAMMSIDLLATLRGKTNAPITAFSVSGENELLTPAPDAVYLEYARALKRAGADLIMTYGALRLADALDAEGSR